LPNFSSIQRIVPSDSRPYSQNMMPRAKKFFVRSFCLLVMSRPSSDRSLSVEIGISKRAYCFSEPSVRGFEA